MDVDLDLDLDLEVDKDLNLGDVPRKTDQEWSWE